MKKQFKKLKEGEHITLNDKRYRVVKACDSKIACRLCQEHNKEIPCAPAGQVNNPVWNRHKCKDIILANCYLKIDNNGTKDKKSST